MPKIYEFEKCPNCDGEFKYSSGITKKCIECDATFTSFNGYQYFRKLVGIYLVSWELHDDRTTIVVNINLSGNATETHAFDQLLPFTINMDQLKLYSVFS